MIDQLPIYLDRIVSAKGNFSEEEWSLKPAPDKWSKKEILGHLVDSSTHNLKRFYDIKHYSTDYQIIPYSQDELVSLQQYNERPWDSISRSLKNLNLEIHNIVNNYTAEDLAKKVIDPYGEVHTAEWLAHDYFAHFEHHLQQIFGKEIIL